MRSLRFLLATCVALPLSAQTQPGYPTPLPSNGPQPSVQQMATLAAGILPALTLRITQNDKELVLDYGPFDLPAENAGRNAATTAIGDLPPRWVTIPDNAWLHGYSVELLDKNGLKVPSTTLQHINVIATQQRELFSPIMLRIAAASGETEPVALPRLLGLEANKGDTLLVRALLHNPTGRSYEGIHIFVRFSLTRRNSTIGSLRMKPFYFDVMPPAAARAFDVPPGRTTRYWDAKPTVNARLVGFSGHVHKYATVLRFEDRTANKVIWETHPDTTKDGQPKAIPVKRFLTSFGMGLDSTHTYRVTVVYDNPTGATIVDGGVGALGGVVHVNGDTHWPSVNQHDAEFQMDQRAIWRP